MIRARIVLAAAEGATNTEIAAEVGVHVDTVRKWRRRFAAAGLPGLDDLPRSGRRRAFTPVQVAEVKALACTLPAETGQPLSRWSSADLATEAITRGLAETISAATVRRWLAADAIKPWQHRSWIFPRDPDFETKAARVLDLYARQWQGQPLGPDDYVISADEKSQLQALARRHRGQPPATRANPTRRVRVPARRHPGLLRRLRRPPRPRARPDRPQDRHRTLRPNLVAQVMTTEPYASARRVFWVVDNGSSHNGARSIERMQTAWPTATLVHLPIHASWLNQVEIYFSILQRKAINPNDFADLDQLSERILGFQDRYNTTATPFDWTYTRDDLNAFLHRLDLHDTRYPHTPHDPRRTYDRDH